MVRLQRDGLVSSAVMLKKNVVTDRIHEGAEAIRLPDAVFGTNGTEYAGECFLAEVVDRIGREPPGTKLQLEKLRKVGNKMRLRRRVSFPEAPKIGLVKFKKFQNSPEVLGSIAVTRRSGNGTGRSGDGTKKFQNETELAFATLLGIGLLEGSGDLRAGTTKVPWRAPEAASGADC
jgi:hypothetical protein